MVFVRTISRSQRKTPQKAPVWTCITSIAYPNAISICERIFPAVSGWRGASWEMFGREEETNPEQAPDSGAFTNLAVFQWVRTFQNSLYKDFADFCQENLREKKHIILRPPNDTPICFFWHKTEHLINPWIVSIETKHPNETSQRTGEHTASSHPFWQRATTNGCNLD